MKLSYLRIHIAFQAILLLSCLLTPQTAVAYMHYNGSGKRTGGSFRVSAGDDGEKHPAVTVALMIADAFDTAHGIEVSRLEKRK